MSIPAVARKIPARFVHREIERIEAGMPFRSLEKLQKSLALPWEKLAAALGMSRATLHRRKLQGKLASSESERLVRYQRLFAQASEVFGGTDRARQWLSARQPGLGGAVPIEFAASELGAREVERLLGRLEFGVYA